MGREGSDADLVELWDAMATRLQREFRAMANEGTTSMIEQENYGRPRVDNHDGEVTRRNSQGEHRDAFESDHLARRKFTGNAEAVRKPANTMESGAGDLKARHSEAKRQAPRWPSSKPYGGR